MSGDLRAATGLSRTQLDYYLREGVVQPTARTESGYLLFDERERDVVERIIAWREEGVGLREIRQRLRREERE
jgi:MerR family Zn(II)-responsive transcriptional regulator of zntA